ncbi:uncharacterized protein [Eurosta solidaginis]|uniref:uncharacterized protein n=1 Tax=Eurosta solidaginis TaxID=178769 RepID=UPI0035311F1B
MISVQVFCSLALSATFAVQVVLGDPISGLTSSKPPPPPSCRPGHINYCANVIIDLVWYLNEKNQCSFFVNRCFFKQQNCDLWQEDRPMIEEVSKEACQPFCANDCSQAPNETICAYSDKGFCTFPSKCEWLKYACNTGQFWLWVDKTPCSINNQSCPTSNSSSSERFDKLLFNF